MNDKMFFFMVLGLSISSCALAQDVMSEDQATLTAQSRRVELSTAPSPGVWHRYVSLNLSSLANQSGIIGIGFRKQNSIHGINIGLNPGTSPSTFQVLSNASYLYQFLVSKDAAYYSGFGAQAGWIWRKQRTRYDYNNLFVIGPRFTIGRSFTGSSKNTQFIEANANWPAVYLAKGDRYYKRRFQNTSQKATFELFYGLLF